MNKVFLEEIVGKTPGKGSKRFNSKVADISMVGEDTPLAPRDKTLKFSHSYKFLWGSALFILTLGVILFFLGKAFVLQVVEGEKNLALSTQNRVRTFRLQAPRGVIFDRNGEVLVRNKPTFSIEINTEVCTFRSIDRFSVCYSEIEELKKVLDLQIDDKRVKSEIDQGKKVITLVKNVDKDKVITLEPVIQKFPSVTVSNSPQRDYVYGEAFAHLIGFTGSGDTLYPSVAGKDGIEKYYDNTIRGLDGEKVIQVNSLGENINVLSESTPISGSDIYLNVDKDLQIKAYDLLKEKVEKGEAEAGVVVAQDPRTGGVLALVNYPSFDPQSMSEGVTLEQLAEMEEKSNFPFFNRAIAASYPPGSTFKMAVASAVLEEDIVSPEYQITDPGYIAVGSFIFRNWKLDGHGPVDIRKAIQVSNDTYFYTVGGGYGPVKGLGISKLHEWLTKFGYGQKTGIDLDGEVSGFMPNGEGGEWYLGNTYITSIGQGDVLSTPLQVNNITTYFANGGYTFKPVVVRQIEGQSEHETEVLVQSIMSRPNYEIVREGMHLSVTPGGTAYPFFDFPQKFGFEVAGKTGTSEYIDSKGEDKTHAWFTVFGPYDSSYNAEIALTVFLEGGGGGSDDAAPIARELFDLWFTKYSR